MLDRGPRPGVGADAEAEGPHLQRCLAHPHQDARLGRVGGVGVQRHGDAVEHAGLLQPFLVVQQQLLVDRRARFEGGEDLHGVDVLHLQALDLDRARAEQRPAVGHQEQPRFVLVGVDVGHRAGPAGGGVACSAQLRQGGRLGVVPGRVAEGLAHPHRPVAAQLVQQLRGAGIARLDQAAEFAVGLQREARHLGARAGVDLQPHAALVLVVAGFARDDDLRREVALGLQQLAHLRRRGVDQARPLAVVDGLAIGQRVHACQVQVAQQQRLQRGGPHHLQRGRGRRRVRRRSGGIGRGGRRAGTVDPALGGALQVGTARQAQEGGERPRRRTQPRHLLSNRIAPSRPASVSGNMRWFISCWTMEMLWRYCHTPCGSGLIHA